MKSRLSDKILDIRSPLSRLNNYNKTEVYFEYVLRLLRYCKKEKFDDGLRYAIQITAYQCFNIIVLRSQDSDLHGHEVEDSFKKA